VRTFWAGLGTLRRDAFFSVGGFDAARFPVAIEDVELGLRLTERGARIRLDPDVQGKHVKSWTLREMVRTDLFGRAVPWLSLLLERGRVPAELNLGWRHRASVGLSLAALLGVVARRPPLLASALAGLIVVNGSFYALLARKRGLEEAAAGVGLHVVHHLTAAVAVPIALLGGRGDNATGR
jgi:hypothetical protein